MINISSNGLKTQNRGKYDVINGNKLVNHFLKLIILKIKLSIRKIIHNKK